jgi:hypothetical protein
MAAFAQERPIKFMEAALLASTAVLGAALVARR